MVEEAVNDLVLSLEKRSGIIKEPFTREITLINQVIEAVNNIRRAFNFTEERLLEKINLKVDVHLIGARLSNKKYFNRIDKYRIDIKVYLEGDIGSAAEFLKQWSRIWIWWYKGYENIDPIEHFVKTAAECGTPKDWWKVKGYVESVETLIKEGIRSDAFDLLDAIKSKNFPLFELKRGIPCPLTGKICPEEIKRDPSLVFVAMPIQPEYEDVFRCLEAVLSKYDLKAWVAQREIRRGHILCKICEKIQSSDNGVFEITDLRPNVMLELGLAYGLGKSILLITKSLEKIPSDLKGLEVIEYRNLEELRKRLEQYFMG